MNNGAGTKPELIAFSQNFLGGVQSFYYNLLSNDPFHDFDKQWILTRDTGINFAAPPAKFNLNEQIIEYKQQEGRWRIAKKISDAISNKDGLVLANHVAELDSLLLYPKPNKTVFHFVHDHLYLDFSKNYQAIIDAFVTHNYQLYTDLLAIFPERNSDIFYLPYGIQLPGLRRNENLTNKLTIAFIARLHKDKGVYDLITIDDLLIKEGIAVNWLITGDGPEKENFLKEISTRANFRHFIFKDSPELFSEIKNCDIFLLPSVLDGTPVALIEAMSVGLVPIVYNFNKGIEKIITEDIGYIVETKDCKRVAEIVKHLHNNRAVLEEKSGNAFTRANVEYNVTERAKDYYTLFKRYKELRKTKQKHSYKIPLLENPMVPYEVARFTKRVLNKLSLLK